MTWVEVIIVACIFALVVSPFVSSARFKKTVRVSAAIALVAVLALYGAEILSDFF